MKYAESIRSLRDHLQLCLKEAEFSVSRWAFSEFLIEAEDSLDSLPTCWEVCMRTTDSWGSLLDYCELCMKEAEFSIVDGFSADCARKRRNHLVVCEGIDW